MSILSPTQTFREVRLVRVGSAQARTRSGTIG